MDVPGILVSVGQMRRVPRELANYFKSPPMPILQTTSAPVQTRLRSRRFLRAVAGSDVTYNVPATGCSGDSGTYELFITLERLQ
jgi:hypothetical protein